METKVVLKKWSINKNRIDYYFDYPHSLGKYFRDRKGTTFFVEYPEPCDLKNIPISVLMIPFVANMLTMSMLLKIPIEVPELDKCFYDSLDKIKKAYTKMFPYIDFYFDVYAHKVVQNNTPSSNLNSSLFFTGGLDATSALVEMLKILSLDNLERQTLTLINIWGGDTSPNDVQTHQNLVNYMKDLKDRYGVQYAFIRSNCREMYNEQLISRFTAIKIRPWDNHGWWASIAHILSMASLIAPLTHAFEINKHYIASSYESSNKVFDANNTDMINAIRFTSCRLFSVDDNLDRTQKAKKIVEFCKSQNTSFELKVCWYNNHGKNCSKCEKCYRTILDILVNYGNPNLFGFIANNNTYREMKKYLENTYINKGYWKPIQNKLREDISYWEQQPELSWLLNIRFNRFHTIIKKGLVTVKKFIPQY